MHFFVIKPCFVNWIKKEKFSELQFSLITIIIAIMIVMREFYK